MMSEIEILKIVIILGVVIVSVIIVGINYEKILGKQEKNRVWN